MPDKEILKFKCVSFVTNKKGTIEELIDSFVVDARTTISKGKTVDMKQVESIVIPSTSLQNASDILIIHALNGCIIAFTEGKLYKYFSPGAALAVTSPGYRGRTRTYAEIH